MLNNKNLTRCFLFVILLTGLSACNLGKTEANESSSPIVPASSTPDVSSGIPAPSSQAPASSSVSNNRYLNFKEALDNVDLNIDLMEGFGFTSKTSETSSLYKKKQYRLVDESFVPEEYGVHYVEDERDYNIYSNIVSLQGQLEPLADYWSSFVDIIKENATELGEFTYEEVTYNLSMANDDVGLISFTNNNPGALSSSYYDYEQGRWLPLTLAEWQSATYELYFGENEFTIHFKRNEVTKLVEEYNDYPLITDEYFDVYLTVKKDENGNYENMTAIFTEGYNYESIRHYHQMYRKEGVVYYLTSEEYPSSNMIDTSFVSFIGSLSISYNVRTCPGEEFVDENYVSWPFLQSTSQYFWTLQVNTATTDAMKVFPEYYVDAISPKITAGVTKVYYPYDWFDIQFDPEYVPSYPAPDWLPGFIGCPMRAIETPNGTYDGVQDSVCYVDSLGIAGNDGTIIPGRGEIASYFATEEETSTILYDFWSNRIAELGISINDDYNQDLSAFMKAYSREDLFNPEKMKEFIDYDYVKQHLNDILVKYEEVFEPSGYLNY